MFTVLNQRRQINDVQKYHYINKSVVKEVYCTIWFKTTMFITMSNLWPGYLCYPARLHM